MMRFVPRHVQRAYKNGIEGDTYEQSALVPCGYRSSALPERCASCRRHIWPCFNQLANDNKIVVERPVSQNWDNQYILGIVNFV